MLGNNALFSFARKEKNIFFISKECIIFTKDTEISNPNLMNLSLPVKMLTCIFLFISTISMAQSKPAYQLYNAKGKKVKYSRMLRQIAKADIVFFGELHNNSLAHWLELEVLMDLHMQNDVQIGAEMLEADNQKSLDAYMREEIGEEEYKETTRLWSNYETDYAPLVAYAKENQIAFTATNIPRRYANMVYKNDFQVLDSLSDEQKSWIAPMPIPYNKDLETYKEILSMMGDHGSPLLVKAQAMKDATMAYFIGFKNS